jgi:ABC-type glycerol-3-phosphate transport system substrate-binding protein
VNGDDDLLAQRLAATLAQAGRALPDAPADAVATARRRFLRRRRRIRALTAAAVALVAAAAVAVPSVALRRTPPPAAEGDGVIRVWVLGAAARNAGLRDRIDAFNAGAGPRVEMTTFGNEAYQEVMTGPGTPDPAPDVYENWGGADLAGAVRDGRAADLTAALDARPGARDLFLPGVLEGGQVGGRQYGLPMTGVQPIVLYYHKRLFADADLSPPTTYPELLAAVDTFKRRGVTPITLAGGTGWAPLMYLEYLTDRLAGPGVFADILARRPGAWRHPAVKQAAAMTQELVRRGAFGPDPGNVQYDDGAASDRLAEGRAAMHLMGSWEYGQHVRFTPAFAASELGWVPFPTVPGGAGDPADLIGSPVNYLSVDAASPHCDEAVDFVARTVTSDEFLDGLLAAGEVPAVRDLEPRLAGHPHADFARFVHRLAAGAPSFVLAWDQALPRPVATVLHDRTRKLVQLRITPEKFVADMAATG